MGIILLEAPHAREAVQRTAELIAVQHAKVRKPQRQLPVATPCVVEQEAVPCTNTSQFYKALPPEQSRITPQA